MGNNKLQRYAEVLLGAVLGVMITLVTIKSTEGNRVRVPQGKWSKLFLILDQADKHYVDTLDYKKITEAAAVAALAQLDPHSIYLPPVELEESEIELAGKFDGIGIQFNVPNDTATVLEVIGGGPAEKVGMLPGDRLIKVDTINIAGTHFPQDSMVSKIKGPSGSKVKILVERGGEHIPFEITRGKIPVNSVDSWFMVDDSTGYVRLSKFTRNTYAEVMQAISNLAEEGMGRLIFDLRGNSGGYFDQSLLLANEFLSKEDLIVYMEGRTRERQDFQANGKGKFQNTKLAVLIDEGSASSSEIFAGAIQDNDRGIIAGRRSFGKGLVQEPVYFTDGSGIRITVARFHTPSGRCIQKPYDNYSSDIYNRYISGEIFSSEGAKVDTTEAYSTVGGRTVYGGGGIVPDLQVPMDTTRATNFYINCNKKVTQMRFAASFFDKNAKALHEVKTYSDLDNFFSKVSVETAFLNFAKTRDGIVPEKGEWEESKPYMLPQLKALIARYTKLGENAFSKYYLPVDETVGKVMKTSFEVQVLPT